MIYEMNFVPDLSRERCNRDETDKSNKKKKRKKRKKKKKKKSIEAALQDTQYRPQKTTKMTQKKEKGDQKKPGLSRMRCKRGGRAVGGRRRRGVTRSYAHTSLSPIAWEKRNKNTLATSHMYIYICIYI